MKTTVDLPAITTAQRSAIREQLGHGDGNRKVRITLGGEVHYYGSTNPFDRGHDWWHFGGYVQDFVR